MRRTCKLYEVERFEFGDGGMLERSEVTVEPFGMAVVHGGERTVWADVGDGSCLYTLEAGLLWRFDGDLL